ncbi:ATP-dependent helicase [Rhodococcus rhodnii]|uniref:DNA 3'-5' helicase n=2 Tax=Rhodococcus rhodnii TaxID=38312 RepID=R7WQ42_9NOCA|nr:ATP-dependent DNA helicase [Rhodococcus rhodnii]EOM77437.1 ATP-dependent DNA helicase [Rhodococcus rhodnii LMG 5362]TXG92604.1 ATP-dependent helicase [Rhodococcus rhodnii]
MRTPANPMEMANPVETVDPIELAAGLGQNPPTPEQAAVIASPLEPVLVVAGAGAGKTETMAARVVWLVANGIVAPGEVLGLTFTRKAAQQLTSRIRQRLARLAGSPVLRELDPSGEIRERILGTEPEIGTYHSYAGRLLSEHGLLLPMEPSAALLSETELWQLAHRVVSTWDGELDTESGPPAVTEAVLALSSQIAEHLVDPDDLRSAADEFATLAESLPPGPKQRADPSQTLRGYVSAQRRRVALLPLVAALGDALRRDNALDFGAQMSLAARLAAEHPEVGAAERERVRVVLLDEYQDTGHSQRVLLSALFGRGAGTGATAVTAVGDPMQSIYGWRGASAANLPRFTTDFPRTDGTPAGVLELSTSWRNPREALALANAVAEPLRSGAVAVGELRSRPGAGAGDVRLALHTDVTAEREWVAAAIAREYRAAHERGEAPPTAAVLVRRNADSAPIAEALRARGLPVEVVGLGGLLHTPEVADVVAMLRVIADPLAGGAALRLLTGARWRLGAADIRALWRRASDLGVRAARGVGGAVTDADALADAVGAAMPGDIAERAGLVDAISDPGPERAYSPAGYERIVDLGRELASLRDHLGQPLTELVAEVERVLGVGIEAGARATAGSGRENLDAFADVVAGYAARGAATTSGLLSFLSAAETVEDGLEPGEVQVDPDRVQVLTVHSAKGLEWQVVAVPHVTAKVFPSGAASATWLGSPAELPPQLRGDRRRPDAPDGIPILDLTGLEDRKELESEITAHRGELADRRLDEERRLFYVALTRTEGTLLVSGHHWAETGDAPKGPSPFLTELRELVDHRAERGDGDAVVEVWEPAPELDASNPLTASPVTATWPPDPLGVRRERVEEGAALVRAALDAPPAPEPVDEGAEPGQEDDPDDVWAADVEALLAERAALRTRGERTVALPSQLSVSALVELGADPGAFAARLQRPLPMKPSPLARRGTAFHAWLERRFGGERLLDFDELPGAADDDAAPDADLAVLQSAFLRSEWAEREPHEVEVPFETSIAGIALRGRIDAVFADRDGGWTVVDWKTGAEPSAEREAAVAVQLAVYRLAWAELAHVDPQRVRAAFHYVRSGRTIAPETLPGVAELAGLLSPEDPAGPREPA